ncbi:MAG: hypothetical protein EOM50_08865 [Erysipelotrichia bacterium]|nr:hypothetical protein [Erysipelotrichia bacterium]NCC54370.1 hypothetical protein [Erysipelotrichia bacterium]
MLCGLDCINFMLVYYKFENASASLMKEAVMEATTQEGISIYDLVRIANAYGLCSKAIKSLWIPKQLPCILYLKNGEKSGHFLVLIKRRLCSFIVYDETYKYRRINKLRLYLFWSHVCILCYNEKKR